MSRTPPRYEYVPLSKASWHFSPRRLREMYWELDELPSPELPDRSSTDFSEVIRVFPAQIHHGLWRTAPAIKAMEEDLIEKLRRGDLEARGLRTHPSLGEDLETIPRYYFDHATIGWKRNVVEKFGRRYEAVEIC